MRPRSRSSTDGLVAPLAAIEQPSQLIPAIQNTCTMFSGPVGLPPRPPIPCTPGPNTPPACGTVGSFMLDIGLTSLSQPRATHTLCVSYTYYGKDHRTDSFSIVLAHLRGRAMS